MREIKVAILPPPLDSDDSTHRAVLPSEGELTFFHYDCHSFWIHPALQINDDASMLPYRNC